jgi:ABC-2 type transport system ATP-binding protein
VLASRSAIPGGRTTETALSIRGLRKVYSGLRSEPTVAVAGLDLDVPAGGVFGFLGPNGAGKTTTIRCALGLVRPTAGEVHLLGSDGRLPLADIMDRVGGLVESPKFFPTFSGRKNLELLGAVRGVGAGRVARVLEEVGLADRADARFASYSLGMKQRLAVASTLLKEPELLILDEPANGLDPAGIKEMRELIRRYGSSGATVFVSSHQLAEVQQMCDSVAIINHGSLVTAGRVDEVLAAHSVSLVVTINDAAAAAGVLRRAGWEVEPKPDGQELRVVAGSDDGPRVTKALADAGLYLGGLREDRRTLEEVFLEVTGDGNGR